MPSVVLVVELAAGPALEAAIEEFGLWLRLGIRGDAALLSWSWRSRSGGSV
jgi:hypothetical protein